MNRYYTTKVTFKYQYNKYVNTQTKEKVNAFTLSRKYEARKVAMKVI
jgi:hypothetical protein